MPVYNSMVWTEKAENNKHMNNAQDYYGIDGCPSAHIYMNIPKIDHLNAEPVTDSL